MKVLLVGRGGREHALAWKIAKSPLLTQLYGWPGHPAAASLATPLDLPPEANHEAVAAAATRLGIDLVVCGPEAPLSEGIADRLAKAGIPTFGPSAAAAQLEASKAFAKAVMSRAAIPTARHRLAADEAECRRLARELLAATGGAVLKASGLAAGKGVFVCRSDADVEAGLAHLYHSEMRSAARTVVVEDLLVGRECSYFTCIGKGGATGLGFAVDFKRLDDDDQGPNTGGMGCYAPVPWLPADAERQVVARVVEPLLNALAEDGIAYQGCLYVGLMWSEAAGPQVIEFNVRLGDPEAEALALLDDRDWLAVMAAKCGLAVPAAALAAATAPLAHRDRAVVVVMASRGYPFGSDHGAPAALPQALFAGPAARGPTAVFGAAVAPAAAAAGPGAAAAPVVTGTGRVLVVGGRGASFGAARALAYQKIDEIARLWPHARWRRDIAAAVAKEIDR